MVSWITDQELTDLRADIAETMPETVVIKRVTSSISSEGYEVGVLLTIATVTGRVDSITRQSAGQYAMLDAARTYYQLTVPYGTAIDDGDVLTINRNSYDVVQAHVGQSKNAVRRALIAARDEQIDLTSGFSSGYSEGFF